MCFHPMIPELWSILVKLDIPEITPDVSKNLWHGVGKDAGVSQQGTGSAMVSYQLHVPWVQLQTCVQSGRWECGGEGSLWEVLGHWNR